MVVPLRCVRNKIKKKYLFLKDRQTNRDSNDGRRIKRKFNTSF